MNTLSVVVNNPLTRQIGWAVLHSLWEGSKSPPSPKRVDDLLSHLNVRNTLVSAQAPVAGDENAPPALMTADTLRKMEALRIESKAEYVRQATLLEQLAISGGRWTRMGSGTQLMAALLPPTSRRARAGPTAGSDRSGFPCC